jgi:hypothetical protein
MSKTTPIPTPTHIKGHHDRIVISWIAPEYIRHQKSARWYLIAGVVVLITLVWAFFTGNWSMALAVLVFTGVYQYINTKHPPKNIRIEISEMGIKVGEMFFPFSNIQAFWIIYENGLRTLNLRVSKHFFSDIIIQLDDQDPVEVRQYLVGQIAEWEGKSEKVGDMLLRLLRL